MATLDSITETYGDDTLRTVSLMFPETMAFNMGEDLPMGMAEEITQALDIIALYERRVLNASDQYE